MSSQDSFPTNDTAPVVQMMTLVSAHVPDIAPTITVRGPIDIVTANFANNNVSLLIGDGSGGFIASTQSLGGFGPVFVTLGDLNGDGHLDVVTANSVSNNVSLLLGNGDGNFTTSTRGIAGGTSPVSIGLGDVNGDGDVDIVTANSGSNNVSVLLGDGLGGFTASTKTIGGGSVPNSVALGDVNGDGHLDIVTTNGSSDNVSVLFGDGLGGFAASTKTIGGGAAPNSVALGDVNGDGHLDIVTTNSGSNNVSVLLGDGLGSFIASIKDIGGGVIPDSVALGDVNGDGHIDIVTTNSGSNNVSVLLGDGLGGFAASTKAIGGGTFPNSIALGDLNIDGHLDIITTNEFSNNVSVFLGDGSGSFVTSTTPIGGSLPFAVALGDLYEKPVIDEDTNLIFGISGSNAISVSDADANGAVETLTLAALHGSVTLASLAGLTVNMGGNSTSTIEVTGTLAALNAALDGLSYAPALNYSGLDTLALTLNDNSSVGTDGPLTTSRSVQIVIEAQNDAPVNAVPGPQSVDEDTSLIFSVGNAIQVSDVDLGSGTETVTVSALHGKLTLGTTAGLSLSGNGTSLVTLIGNATDVNAALNGLTYKGIPNFNGGDTLKIVTSDNGNTGQGGALSDTDTVAITVNPVNDAPVNIVPDAQSVNEDSNLAIGGLVVTDVDAGPSGLAMETTLSVTHGTLTVGSAGGATVVGNGSATITLDGSQGQINTALSAAGNLIYRGVQDFNGFDTLTITTSDLGNRGAGGAKTDIDTVAITVNPVNDAPVAANESVSGNEDTAIAGVAAASDVDNTAAQLSFSLVGVNGGAAHGSVILNANGSFTYTPTTDFNGSDGFVFKANDGQLDSNVATESLTIAAVNDAPVITSNGGGDTASLVVPVNGIAVTTIHAIDVDSATLAYAIAGGADQTQFQINAVTGALSFVSGPSFEMPGDADHNNSYVVQVRASDGSLTDTQTLTVNVTSVPNIDAGFSGDLGGDHRSDLLIRDATGAVTLWQMNGAQIQSQQNFGAIGNEWHLETSADLGGDGRSDILWRADDGTLALWQMSGAQIQSNQSLGKIGAEWQVDGTGDFNGDGKADILWRADNSTVAIWQMDGANLQSNQTVGSVGFEWHAVGLGDFNGDHNSDILWRADDGSIALWQMNGPKIAANVSLGKVGTEWHIVGTGDFNGDGQTDILWRADNGTLATWQMNSLQVQSSQTIGAVGPEWHVYGAPDLDGDGKADILFRNDDGSISAWQMDGTHIAAQETIGPLAVDATLGVHHYDLL